MLYDGAIRFCDQARKALQEQHIEESYHLLGKVQKIVLELIYALHDDYAPETCANMRKLYLFCYDRLIRANIDKDVKLVDEATRILRHLRETWVLLMEKLKQEKAQQQAEAGPLVRETVGAADDGNAGVGGSISLEG